MRDEAADLRDGAADLRPQSDESVDATSATRDHEADQRDQEADQRDQEADQRDREAAHSDPETKDLAQSSEHDERTARESAAADRRHAGSDRVAAALGRTAASGDRLASSSDRQASSEDRTLSAGDREASADDRTILAESLYQSSLDGLTGAYLRGAGQAELERDLLRAKRTGQPFTVAFVDVDGLKRVNDLHGHAAGDRQLRLVAEALRERLRPFDLVIRWGGDEFVCAVAGMSKAEVAGRVALINDTLASRSEGHASVTVGLAELETEDSVESLIARADTALYTTRGQIVTTE